MSKNFDLDLNFGEIFEKKVNDMLKCKGDIEVKTERDKWAETGNICIEIRYKGEPSGLSITEADTWIHFLSINNSIVGGFIFPVKELKFIVKRLLIDSGAKIVYGGDNGASELVLLPIDKIFEKGGGYVNPKQSAK